MATFWEIFAAAISLKDYWHVLFPCSDLYSGYLCVCFVSACSLDQPPLGEELRQMIDQRTPLLKRIFEVMAERFINPIVR